MQEQVAKKILLLGKGYVTEFFKDKINHYFPSAELSITSRSKPDCIYFKLEDASSWDNINNHYDVCVWTFPVYDLKLFQAFYAQKKLFFKKLILIGTTSSYKVDYDQQQINEHSALDEKHKRYHIEQFCLANKGIVLRSAGIYGPDKNPLRWVKEGRIKSSRNSIVNWVHVYDLVQFIAHTILYGLEGQQYIAADCQPMAWHEFFEFFQLEESMSQTVNASNKLSKCIDNHWSKQQLQILLKYTNVLEGCKNLL